MKHTEGPWSINEWPQNDNEIRIGATGTLRLATVHLRNVSINEQQANAQLISAAPNLYRELTRLIEKISRANAIRHSGGRLTIEDWAELCQVVKDGRKALAKADEKDTKK